MLSRKEIDVIGQNIVGDFMPEALKSPQEIDIDLLAQDYLGMDQDFQYLSHCGVYLGMTVFNDTDKVPVYDPQNNCADYISAKAHTVIIDKTLLEENQEHRYRFTMGHEAGHEFLHKEYFAYDPDQITLFDLMEKLRHQWFNVVWTQRRWTVGHRKAGQIRTGWNGRQMRYHLQF